jgi:hypothetical protein
MTDVTGLDKKGTLKAIFQFAIASEMYLVEGHIIKYGQQHDWLVLSNIPNLICAL